MKFRHVYIHVSVFRYSVTDSFRIHYLLVKGIALGRAQLRMKFATRAIWKTLKIKVQLFLDCTRTLVITCLRQNYTKGIARLLYPHLGSPLSAAANFGRH